MKHGEPLISHGRAAILSANGAKVPGVSLKVRLCSSLVAGDMFFVGVALDYPQLIRLALPIGGATHTWEK